MRHSCRLFGFTGACCLRWTCCLHGASWAGSRETASWREQGSGLSIDDQCANLLHGATGSGLKDTGSWPEAGFGDARVAGSPSLHGVVWGGQDNEQAGLSRGRGGPTVLLSLAVLLGISWDLGHIACGQVQIGHLLMTCNTMTCGTLHHAHIAIALHWHCTNYWQHGSCITCGASIIQRSLYSVIMAPQNCCYCSSGWTPKIKQGTIIVGTHTNTACHV